MHIIVFNAHDMTFWVTVIITDNSCIIVCP